MLKTIKGKVIAGVAAVVLISGATAAFGATDSGGKLKEWFEAQFGIAKAEVEGDTDAYFSEGYDGLNDQLEGLKSDATSKINNSADKSTRDSKANIGKAANEHIGSITSKRAELEGYMDSEFAKLVEAADARILKTRNSFSRYADKEMGSHTGTAGVAARDFVDAELKTATTQALSDIQAAIDAAKADLQALLDQKATATTDEIKGLIDTSVAGTSYWITSMTNYMVQEQEELIEAAAGALEKDAKQQMQDLVDGI